MSTSKFRRRRGPPVLQQKDSMCAELGRVFKAKRKEARITLSDLSDILDLNVTTIRRHEYGTRMLRLDDIVRAATAFKCRPEELVTGKEDASDHD